jgi:LysM repeat protein
MLRREMRGGRRHIRWLAAGTLAAAPATASAGAVHVVRTGESLSSIAAQDGLTPAAIAAANGLPAGALLRAGATITIPAATPRAPAIGIVTPVAAASPGVADGETGTGGVHLVTPGESLWALAGRLGVSERALAAANGLSSRAMLIAGQRLIVPGAGTGITRSGPASTTAGTVPVAPAVSSATGGGSVSGSDIANASAAAGVPSGLGEAVAWQESGFNNGLTSSADAHGVMQILPSTWTFIRSALSSAPLNPFSPLDNVRAGVLYLRYLLRQTGSVPTAVAAYYQGLGSVRRNGVLPETERYVNNVLALSRRFG